MSRRVWPTLMALLAACSGEISGSGGQIPGGSSTAGPGSAAGTSPVITNPGSWNAGVAPVQTGGTRDDGAQPEVPAPGTRFARLTHTQWENSVRDLLRLSAAGDLTTRLRADARSAGFLFDNYGATLTVDDALVSAYQQVAEQLAEEVSSDDAALRRLTDESDAAGFVQDFASRAHRHPLTSEQRSAYESLFSAGPEMFGEMDPFAAGVRMVVEAALQSPYFLYRVELSEQEAAGVIPLDSYEVAARLSYALWNSMPDDALFEAAENGQLSDAAGRRKEVERMLADARAQDVVLLLHDQLLDTAKFSSIKPADAFFDVSPELPQYAYQEHERFVRTLMVEEQGGVRTLLTSRETFVNEELAQIYGLSGSFGDDFQRAELDKTQRAGVFTHVGFLAANSTSADPDPIHRGKFIAERVACVKISAPPVNVPAPPQPGDKTNREVIEEFTEAPGSECSGCHKALINPFGFPLENLDAVGAFRTEDRGKMVRTDAEPMVDFRPTAVVDGVDMMEKLADSESVHVCYAKHLLEYALGRPAVRSDDPLVDRLGAASFDQDLSVKELLLELVSSDAFLVRSVEEGS